MYVLGALHMSCLSPSGITRPNNFWAFGRAEITCQSSLGISITAKCFDLRKQAVFPFAILISTRLKKNIYSKWLTHTYGGWERMHSALMGNCNTHGEKRKRNRAARKENQPVDEQTKDRQADREDRSYIYHSDFYR
jgi:hypothetical protein